ncbi:MAG: hypothetical protein KAS61_05420 [Spirochaetes bacterium]|nr:hypothetical protein [Spirochaetota bacterium]
MSGTNEKNDEVLGTEEDETIALSTNELDDLLSESAIVQEKPQKAEDSGDEAPAKSEEDFNIPVTEEEFDISGEIDQLTPEDLENIELEESEIESFSKELEEELGEEIELPEGLPEEEAEVVSPEEIIEELEGIDTGELSFEPEMESVEIDLESLEEVDTEAVDLGDLELGEEIGEQELSEPPVLGEDSIDIDLEADEAFNEAEIEGIAETVTIDDVDLEGIEGIAVEEELPSIGEEAGEVTLEDLTEDEFSDLEAPEEIAAEEPVEKLSAEEFIEELPSEEPAEEAEVPELTVEELPDEGFADEIQLGEEEEKILSEDFDLTAGVEELPEEEVVTISGEELGKLDEEGAVDAALLNDITTILKFMDTLLGDLPDEKIKEFAQSEYFPLYKEVFEKLNLT